MLRPSGASEMVSKELIAASTKPLILAVLFIGGVQLISIGIIGEYMSRMSANVRNRPSYIVDEKKLD